MLIYFEQARRGGKIFNAFVNLQLATDRGRTYGLFDVPHSSLRQMHSNIILGLLGACVQALALNVSLR